MGNGSLPSSNSIHFSSHAPSLNMNLNQTNNGPSPTSSILSTLSPTAPCFYPSHSANIPIGQNKKGTAKVSSPMTKSKDDIERDFLKRELNIVKTKIKELESENKDLKRKNQILSDMVKLLENQKQEELLNRNNTPTHPSSSPPPAPN